jgi:hypothetical protein
MRSGMQNIALAGVVMSRYIRSVVVVVLALAGLAFAQKAPKYDKTTEAKLTITVDEVKVITAENGQQRIYLLAKDGTEAVEVYLAPKAYLDDMSTTFAKGDKLEITGSKIKKDEGTVVLAREVVQGNNTLVLRDKTGEPVWSWMEKRTAEGK